MVAEGAGEAALDANLSGTGEKDASGNTKLAVIFTFIFVCFNLDVFLKRI